MVRITDSEIILKRLLGGIQMKQTIIITIALCLAISIFVGWDYYNKTGNINGSMKVSNLYMQGE